MAPAAKDTSKKDGKKTRKDAAKSKDSVEKEPSVELTEEEQLEESRKAVEEMMGVSVYELLQHGDRSKPRRASAAPPCRGSCTSGNWLTARRMKTVYNRPKGWWTSSTRPSRIARGTILHGRGHGRDWSMSRPRELRGRRLRDEVPERPGFLEKLEGAFEDKECRVLMCTEDCHLETSRETISGKSRKNRTTLNFRMIWMMKMRAWDLFQDVLKVHQPRRRNVPDPMDCGAADFIPSADRDGRVPMVGPQKAWFTLRLNSRPHGPDPHRTGIRQGLADAALRAGHGLPG